MTRYPKIPILNFAPIDLNFGGFTRDMVLRHVPGFPMLSLPWLKPTSPVRPTPEAALNDADEWLRGYVSADPFGNMGHVLGVAKKDTGYVGIVNYFHSNT